MATKRPVRSDAATIVRQIDAELERVAGRTSDDDSEPLYAAGDRVQIHWRTKWYDGEILAVDGDLYRVHYLGWGASWDEDVGADRLRPIVRPKKRTLKVVER